MAEAPGTLVRTCPRVFDPLELHELNPCRYPHLLESAAEGPNARWDILFAFPGETLTLHADGQLAGIPGAGGGFLDRLDQCWRGSAGQTREGLPFSGGWFLYLGYELAGQIEPRLQLPAGAGPVASATRFPAAVLRERSSGQCLLVAETGHSDLLDAMEEDIARLLPAARTELPEAVIEEEPPVLFEHNVRRALDYIRDGDIFQANLSRAWRGRFARPVPPATLYRRLRRANPGPFNGLATWEGRAVVSSSPERLVEVRGREIATRPIAGTRPRGADAGSDRGLSRELLAHPKERAEHIMLIDLERNDLGRVCEYGSVRADELMVLESYAHVHHIVSSVRGRLREGVTPGQVIRALFPGGTITGCPKVRCMEIIAELEGEARGAYTGSMGYLNHDGSMDLNILIRTVELREDGRFEFRAGAGIVADSDPGRELEETRAKARGMLAALHG